MSEPINDGGPAFPTHVPEGPILSDGQPENPAYTTQGMSLRDWFAGQALAGMMANPAGNPDWTYSDYAVAAYTTADKALKAREVRQ